MARKRQIPGSNKTKRTNSRMQEEYDSIQPSSTPSDATDTKMTNVATNREKYKNAFYPYRDYTGDRIMTGARFAGRVLNAEALRGGVAGGASLAAKALKFGPAATEALGGTLSGATEAYLALRAAQEAPQWKKEFDAVNEQDAADRALTDIQADNAFPKDSTAYVNRNRTKKK